MSKMDKHSLLPASMLAFILLAAICFTAHILIENFYPLVSQPAAAASIEPADPCEHSHDLAQTSVLPSQPFYSETPAVIVAALPARQKIFTPVLQPPKI